MTPPKWTVRAQRQIGKYISVTWHFFETEEEAEAKYLELSAKGWIGCKRPWHRTDLVHMGIADRSDLEYT